MTTPGSHPSAAGRSADADTNSRPWTTRRLLRWMIDYFTERGIDSPRLVAEMLLAHVIGCERMRLYMEVDRPASPMERAALRDLVARAGKHEPAQYLVGHGWFFGKAFEVDRSTLIPRPSTETLIEEVLQWHRLSGCRDDAQMVDLGTGSGCIAVTLAIQLPRAGFLATDLVHEALECAGRNAATHGVADRIRFRVGETFMPLEKEPPGTRFDAILANPPYISDAEWAAVAPNVRDYEPATALRGGTDGMSVVGPILDGAARWLRPGGLLAVEIAHSQRERALEWAEATGMLEDIRVVKDHEDFWRVLVARTPE